MSPRATGSICNAPALNGLEGVVRQEASNIQFPAALITVLFKLISMCGVFRGKACAGRLRWFMEMWRA